MDKDSIPIGPIEERIYTLRGKRVMLDADLVGLLRRDDQAAERTGAMQSGSAPAGFFVYDDRSRAYKLEVAKCDLK